MALTTKASNGTMPQIRHAVESKGRDALFHSMREQALILDGTCRSGYGVLPAGTIMQQDSDGLLFPYPGTAYDVVLSRSLVLQDVGSGATTLMVSMDDSYKYVVGDSLFMSRNGAYMDLGAITDIDRDTYSFGAVITFTNAPGDATYTIAAGTAIYMEADTTEADGMEALTILDGDYDTGTGENAAGALVSFVLSNAILYKIKMENVDASALSDLGAIDRDPYIVLK